MPPYCAGGSEKVKSPGTALDTVRRVRNWLPQHGLMRPVLTVRLIPLRSLSTTFATRCSHGGSGTAPQAPACARTSSARASFTSATSTATGVGWSDECVFAGPERGEPSIETVLD